MLISLIMVSQCEISQNGDAWYVAIPYQSGINYCPPSLNGQGSCLTWETSIGSDLYSGIRKKYQYRILNLTQETSFQLNIGSNPQNFGNGFFSYPYQNLNELQNIMSEDYTSFLYTPQNIPLYRTGIDFFIMDGCPHDESSSIIVSSKYVGYPVDYMFIQNEHMVGRCLSDTIGYIDLNPWNRMAIVGLTLPAGQYWIYVGFEIENGVSNWGWIQWSLTLNLTPCNVDVFFETTLQKPKESSISRYKKVVLMDGPYRGILLYDDLEHRYYDFTLREVKIN